MILLEITDASSESLYEILDISPKDFNDLDDKEVSRRVRDAAKAAKKPHNKAAQRGDKDAEEVLKRINQAETKLKNRESRETYDEELQSGIGITIDVLRVQQAAPPFFWDRNTRFRLIERLLQETGLGRASA